MTIVIAIVAVIGLTAAAGTAWLAHLLRRDRLALWRPGDQLPDVPPDAPIRHWECPAGNTRRERTAP